jgi:hypothetical protein
VGSQPNILTRSQLLASQPLSQVSTLTIAVIANGVAWCGWKKLLFEGQALLCDVALGWGYVLVILSDGDYRVSSAMQVASLGLQVGARHPLDPEFTICDIIPLADF